MNDLLKTVLLVFLYTSAIPPVLGFQSPPVQNSSQVDRLLIEKGAEFLNALQYDKALPFYEKAAKIYESLIVNTTDTSIWSGYIDAQNGLHTIQLSKKDQSSCNNLPTLLEKGQTHLGKNHPSVAITHYHLGFCAYYKGKYEEAMNQVKKALVIQTATLGELHIATANSYNFMGLIFWRQHFPEKAQDHFRKSLSIKEKIVKANHPSFANSYNNIALIFWERGDYEKAIENHERAKRLRIKAFGHDHPAVASSYENIGNVYYRQGWYTNKTNRTKKFEKALKNYEEALIIRKTLFGPDDLSVAYTYGNIALVYGDQQEYDKSIDYFKKQLNVEIKVHGRKSPLLANTYNNICYVYTMAGLEEQALEYSHKALQSLFYNFSNDDVNANPTLTDKVTDTQGLIGVLLLKSQTLLRLFQKDSTKEEHLQLAYKTITLAADFLDKFRQEYTRPEERKYLLTGAFYVYEETLKICDAYYELTQQDSFLHKAFEASEKNKSILLLEDISDKTAKSLAINDKVVLDKEEQLSQLIATQEKELYEEESRGKFADLKRITSIHDQLFSLKKSKDSLTHFLEQKYPDYFELKHELQVATIADLQKNITDEQTALLEYFISRRAIYAFVIQKETFQLVKIKKDTPLKHAVDDLRKGIYTYHLTANRSNQFYTAYADTMVVAAHQLYQQLIAPIDSIAPLPKKLFIIPDDIMGYIPFELLLKQLPTTSTNFGTHDYLLKEHEVSYAYSATLLQKMQKSQYANNRKDLLAFAPSFDRQPLFADATRSVADVREQLTTLEHNVPEIIGIQQLIGGDIYTKQKATENTFLANAADYKILHLSTHGKANVKAGAYAFLAFTEIKDTLENEFIYNQDLYNLQIEADMVVLSACETGIGEIQEGEGVISLARGFSYAGAKSVITTLWSVNDAKTKDLMVQFYTYIKAGKNKAGALRQTKLDFIDEYGHTAHPFYWAAFIPLGDMSPITFSPAYFWNGIGAWNWIGLVVFSVICLFFYRKTKK